MRIGHKKVYVIPWTEVSWKHKKQGHTQRIYAGIIKMREMI